MLTIFSTPKPFVGHIGVIQRNALKSWTLLHPTVEVILFGDEQGAATAARELGIRHESHVEKNEFGTNRIDFMFTKAQQIARHEVLCYVNCDIILLQDFRAAISRVREAHSKFLGIGRRWDTEVTEPIDFTSPDWESDIRRKALLANHKQSHWLIDFFAFSRGFFVDIPPFAVGRVRWDNWVVWNACNSGQPVVDLSPVVMPVHQNHDYSHHPQGKKGVYDGEEGERNLQLAGGWGHLRTNADATEILRPSGLRHNWKREWMKWKRLTSDKW